MSPCLLLCFVVATLQKYSSFAAESPLASPGSSLCMSLLLTWNTSTHVGAAIRVWGMGRSDGLEDRSEDGVSPC